MSTTLPAPAPGRERAAMVWQRALTASVAGALLAVAVLLVTLFADLSPTVLVWTVLLGLVAVLVACVAAIGIAWACAMPFWKAARVGARYVVDVVLRLG